MSADKHENRIFEEIDRTGLTQTFFALPYHRIKSKLRPWYIIITLLIAGAIVIAPVPEGLTREGMNAIAIFVLCILFWVANAIPLMITSLFAIILLPLLGVMDAGDAYALFGNQAVFFILGAFILASAVMQSGLSTRIALKLLTVFGNTPRRLMMSMLLLPAALAFVMACHAVAAMMYPIVLELIDAMGLKKGSRYAMGLMLAMAWGTIIGGIATFLGGARAILAVSILEETTDLTIAFVPWMLAALPAVIITLIVAGLLLLWMTRGQDVAVNKAIKQLEKDVSKMGKWSYHEWGVGILLTVTILAWVVFGQSLGLANIALVAVVVAFMFKLLSWKQVEHDVNWGIILLYGGAIALGFALSESGAAAWMVDLLLISWVHTAGAALLVLIIIAKAFTEGMSNTAVIALLMPIGIAIASATGVDPRVITLAIALPAGLAFMFPISTPATAIALSSGYVKTPTTAWTGLVLHGVSAIVLFGSALWLWPAVL